MIQTVEAFQDKRGTLIPIEFKELPFIPKRIFLINDVPINCIRGGHAHYKTKQYICCINGLVEVILHDGSEEKTYSLKKMEAILVPELIWDAQKFLTHNSELLVICSTEFDINDYITDFNLFKNLINGELA